MQVKGAEMGDEWRALWASCLIVNEASANNGLATVSCEVRCNKTIDNEVTPP